MMDKISKVREGARLTRYNSTVEMVSTNTAVAVRAASDNLDCDYKAMPHSREWFSNAERAKLAQSALRLLKTNKVV